MSQRADRLGCEEKAAPTRGTDITLPRVILPSGLSINPLALLQHCGNSALACWIIRAATMEIDTSKGNPAMDYTEHTSTYKGFLKVTQYGLVALVLLLVGMFMFLVPAQH
jgi:hypothetical protein